MSNDTSLTALCQYLFVKLEQNMGIGGKTIPAGTEVLLLPQTTAESVRVPGNMSLAEAWNTFSRVGHVHNYDELIAGYQEQLTRWADRLTSLEAWAVDRGYVLPETSK